MEHTPINYDNMASGNAASAWLSANLCLDAINNGGELTPNALSCLNSAISMMIAARDAYNARSRGVAA